MSRDDYLTMLWSLEKATIAAIPHPGIPTFVEIGTHKAASATMLMLALDDMGLKTRFRTLDIPKKQRVMARAFWKKRGLPVKKTLSLCDADFIEKPLGECNSGDLPDPWAWVFVDGCHCRQCVIGELEIAAWKLIGGGIIVFHDCGEAYRDMPPDQKYHGDLREFGVLQAVEESKTLREKFKLVAISDPVPHKEHYLGGAYFYQKRIR